MMLQMNLSIIFLCLSAVSFINSQSSTVHPDTPTTSAINGNKDSLESNSASSSVEEKEQGQAQGQAQGQEQEQGQGEQDMNRLRRSPRFIHHPHNSNAPSNGYIPQEVSALFNLTSADERALVELISALNSSQQVDISHFLRNASQTSVNALNSQLTAWAQGQGGQIPSLLNAYLASQRALRNEILSIHAGVAANLSADARDLDSKIMAILTNDDLSPYQQCTQMQTILQQNVTESVIFELGSAFGRLPRHRNCNSTGWGWHGHGHRGAGGINRMNGMAPHAPIRTHQPFFPSNQGAGGNSFPPNQGGGNSFPFNQGGGNPFPSNRRGGGGAFPSNQGGGNFFPAPNQGSNDNSFPSNA